MHTNIRPARVSASLCDSHKFHVRCEFRQNNKPYGPPFERNKTTFISLQDILKPSLVVDLVIGWNLWYLNKNHFSDNKQFLDEVEHDIKNSASADNTDLGFDNS